MTVMDMHSAQLRTAMESRENLTGVEQQIWVEGAFHALLVCEINGGKHHRHQVALFDADPMLACQHTTDLDAQP